MNQITVNAFYDELEKIAVLPTVVPQGTIRPSGDPFAGDPRFTSEGMAKARAEAQSAAPVKPKPIQYAPTKVDPLAQVPPRRPVAPAPAAAAAGGATPAASRIGRVLSRIGPKGRMAGLGLAGLGAGYALG